MQLYLYVPDVVPNLIKIGSTRMGQVRTADKSNESTTIPELLATLDIKGAIITIDAMGCQHNIAAKIVASGADYVLGVKDNQPGLAEAAKLWFDAADGGKLDRPFWGDIQTEKITDGSKPSAAW
jgi:hypothetical protein